jgi:pre-mRNA-splicing factor SYF1
VCHLSICCGKKRVIGEWSNVCDNDTTHLLEKANKKAKQPFGNTRYIFKMPSVDVAQSVESLSSLFPLTYPVPTPLNTPDLLTPKEIYREEDLLRNPSSFRQWWSAIHATQDAVAALDRDAVSPLPENVASLLGPLATPTARHSLQHLTYLYASALAQFPTSFKLWKAYLQMRMSYVLGKGKRQKRAGGRKKLVEMKEAMEDEQFDAEVFDGGLDGIVGWKEWKSLVATFEQALMWLPNVRCVFGC